MIEETSLYVKSNNLIKFTLSITMNIQTMTQNTYKIGFSPCPNDTFIFDALVHQKIDTKNYRFEYVLEDVETLNEWALDGQLPITKLSYHAYLHTVDKYIIADSGSALGRGVGPLIIANNALEGDLKSALKNKTIGIPGFYTTAHLLFKFAFPDHQQKEFLVFNEIENKVIEEQLDAGIIIHENRFTYEAKGLHKWLDLGTWWEENTKQHIPLGGIAIDRSLPQQVQNDINDLIRKSVDYAYDQLPSIPKFVEEHAQEMDTEVMKKHIHLYVNEYSKSLGEEGRAAIDYVFTKAVEKGWIDTYPEQLYL